MQFSDLSPFQTQPIFSSNSTYLAYYYKDNVYIKYTSIDLKNHSVIPCKNKASKKPVKLYFSPDENLIAILTNGSKVEVYDTEGKLKSRIEDSLNEIQSVVWAPDSVQLLVFNSHPHRCQIYNLSLGSISEIKKIKTPSAQGCAFSRGQRNEQGGSTGNGLFMAMLEKHDRKDSIGIYYVPDWKLLNHITLESFDAIKIQFIDNGTLAVYENCINFKVYFVDCNVGLRQTYFPTEYTLGMKVSKCSSNELFLAIGSYDQTVHLMNTKTCKLIAQLDCSQSVIDCSKTKLFRELSINQDFEEITEGHEKLKTIKQKPQNPLGICHIEFHHECQFLAVKNEVIPECIFIWNMYNLELQSVISLAKPVKDFKWMPEQGGLCVLTGKQELLIWKGKYIEYLELPKGTSDIAKLEIGDQGKIIFSTRKAEKKFIFAALH